MLITSAQPCRVASAIFIEACIQGVDLLWISQNCANVGREKKFVDNHNIPAKQSGLSRRLNH